MLVGRVDSRRHWELEELLRKFLRVPWTKALFGTRREIRMGPGGLRFCKACEFSMRSYRKVISRTFCVNEELEVEFLFQSHTLIKESTTTYDVFAMISFQRVRTFEIQ